MAENLLENHVYKIYFDELVERLSLDEAGAEKLARWFLKTGATEYARLKAATGFNRKFTMQELTKLARTFMESENG